jgi:hypothetical protein
MKAPSGDTLELLIESELKLLWREATVEAPLPERKVRAEEEIIASNYGPFAAFDKSIEADLDYFWLPLIQSMIDTISKLRLEHGVPYGQRDSVFKRYFKQIVHDAWQSAVSNGYRVATSHVAEKTGTLHDYKKRELAERREDYLQKSPEYLIEAVENRLAKAIGETNLKITKMKKDQRTQNDTNQAAGQPAWRLAAVVVVLGIGLLGFWILPLQGAIAWLLISVFLLPLIIAGISHEKMRGKDFREMYVDGLKQLPVIGEFLGIGRASDQSTDKSGEDKDERDS